jgi:enoyl-CoA hydratase/carnithine racemase
MTAMADFSFPIGHEHDHHSFLDRLNTFLDQCTANNTKVVTFSGLLCRDSTSTCNENRLEDFTIKSKVIFKKFHTASFVSVALVDSNVCGCGLLTVLQCDFCVGTTRSIFYQPKNKTVFNILLDTYKKTTKTNTIPINTSISFDTRHIDSNVALSMGILTKIVADKATLVRHCHELACSWV